MQSVVSRGLQLEAAVDRLPDWYFHDVKKPHSPPALGPLCETAAVTEDKPQPVAEPLSNATMSSDDEMELEKLHKPAPDDRVRSVSSRRSTASSTASYTDLLLSGFSMRGREKRVMYHIDVVDHDAPLQTYTIRRSYSDFKDLHLQLSEILENRQQYYHSKAASRLARGLAPLAKDTMTPEDKLERAVMAFALPALPHAGFLTFWKRHDRAHLQSRCESFQELLGAVQRQPFLRESFAMQKFLSVAPCAIRDRGSSYVSLCEYSVPTLNPKEEQRERKRRAQEYRRNSSSSTPSARRVEY